MPLSIKAFLEMLQADGCTWEIDANGHYRVYWKELFVTGFAVSHGKKTKGGEVWDQYKFTYRSRLKRVQQNYAEEQQHDEKDE